MPKTISEQYIELLDQIKTHSDATKNKTAPQPGEKPSEFIAFEAEGREPSVELKTRLKPLLNLLRV